NKIKMMSSEKTFVVEEVGVFAPEMKPVERLEAGEVGYFVANMKEIADTQVGDTVTDKEKPATEPLPGYREVVPMVLCGFYPIENSDYLGLKDALEKLKLNDAALAYEPETSQALGFGFRCGFLGLLHMEIVQERLEREFDLTLITTAPTVVYDAYLRSGALMKIDNPSKMPDPTRVDR